MKSLKEILFNVPILKIIGTTELEVSHITFDSRNIRLNTLFIAQKGTATDGHLFIDDAIKKGANAIICQELPNNINSNVTYILVNDSDLALSFVASNYFDHPSGKLKLVGITGTNGKTTLATLSHDLFQNSGINTGLISTVVIKIGEKEYPTSHTTPDALTINHYLHQMIIAGVTHCFMEVSSHGIQQKRTEALHFVGGVFTNLTHDHLDYHETFANYRDVKKSFFDKLLKTSFALSNIDDKNGKVMLQNTKAIKRTYALKTMADYKAKIVENRIEGLHLQIDGFEVWSKLIGNFNAYNLLAIYAIAKELGLESLEILRIISLLDSVRGRFQYFISDSGVTTIVDYAHTPDALLNVLQTIQEVRNGNEKVLTIVGCGGNRDKTKRPMMAKIASQMSNTAIFTSDNPRFEDPKQIIAEMEAGVSKENYHKTLSIIDRKEAIKAANKMVNEGDIVLIAGKGHETYQEINGVKYDFDDVKIAKEIFNNN